VFVGLTLLTLLLIAGPVAVKALPNSYSPLSPHKPIVIDGNGGFTLDNGVTIGNGTVSNPYVIEGLDISQGSLVCAFYDGCGLNVRNTDAYFVIRNTYVHVPSYGVVFYNVENGIIENSIVSDNGLGGIEVIGSSYITVLEDNITGNGYVNSRYAPARGDITVGTSTKVVVSRNIISNMQASASNLAVSENRFDSPSGSVGLFLDGVYNSIISHNQFLSTNSIRVAIWVLNSIQLTISGNLFTSSGILFGPVPSTLTFTNFTVTTDNLIDGKPIYYFNDCDKSSIDGVAVGQLIVANCSDFRASNLQISNVPVGITMSKVDNAVMTGIKFSDESIAFSVYGSNHVTFSGNELVRSGSWWYSWFDHVSNSIITGNNVSSTLYGIGITHGQNLTLSENNFLEKAGLYFESSSDNLAYHNNFIQPAIDYLGSQNRWDNGYPSGGNYWRAYSGVDNCSGSDQDVCTGEDGIGDASFTFCNDCPYVMDSITDHYPLMKQFAPLVFGTAKFDPNVISLNSVSRYLTTSIQLPPGLNVSNVIISSIRLNGTIALAAGARAIVVSPNNPQVLIVRLNVTELRKLFTKPGSYSLYLSGNIVNSTTFRPFRTSNIIRVQAG